MGNFRKCKNGGCCVLDVMGNWCVFCKIPFGKNYGWVVSGKYRQGHLCQGLKYWEDFFIVADSDREILESPAKWMIGRNIKDLLEYYSSGDVKVELVPDLLYGIK